MTDWGAVKDRVKGLAAGVDLEMPGGPGAQDAAIVQAVQDGSLDTKQLDTAVRRMLRFADDAVLLQKKDASVDRMAHSSLSQSLAEQCAVLLKNDGTLPLCPTEQAAFIGAFARTPRYQGAGSSHINTAHVEGALEAAAGKPVVYAQGYDLQDNSRDQELLQEAVRIAGQASSAVIFAGLPDSFETEGGDRTTLALPENQNALISAVAKVNPHTVVVLHGGSVMALPWLEEVEAVLCMYLGGERVGAAAVRLLYGEVNPSGRLAETWPRRLEDNPSFLNFPGEDGIVNYAEGIFVGYRYYDKKAMEVLFPFGYGLSYTTFAYDRLRTDRTTMTDAQTMSVTCTIRNIGHLSGKEVVQLYIRREGSAVARPIRELKGFEKVLLEPGEAKDVSFALDFRSFAYYEPKIHDWYVESGSYIIEVGSSSRNIMLSTPVEVTATAQLPVHFTRFSTIGEVMQTPQGKSLIDTISSRRRQQHGDMQEAHEKSMGEGSAKLMQQMMMEMPLCNLVTYGVLKPSQLENLIETLNM